MKYVDEFRDPVKAAGYYLSDQELTDTLNDAYLNALDAASLEVESTG